MKYLALLISILVSISLLFVSKLFFIVDLLIIPIVFKIFSRKEFKCPNCSHIQKEFIGVKTDTSRQMTHGRITVSGKYDKRYNTEFSTNSTYTYFIDCNNCRTTYGVIK